MNAIIKSLKLLKKGVKSIEKKLTNPNGEIQIPVIRSKGSIAKEKSLVHIAAFTYGNAGDAILPTAVRDTVEYNSDANFNWTGIHAHTVVDDKVLEKINRTKGVIIGGGGLFLADTNTNHLSGWQWSCSMDSLAKIKVPIALVGVGYNRFRHQPEFSPLFTEHVNLLAEKSVQIGLRNHGSIENMKRYIRPEFHDKIRFQPCPTTIISHLYPKLVAENREDVPFIALNCAFDRSHLRFGEEIGAKLTAIAKVAKKLSENYEIRYFSHVYTDDYFLPFLDCFKVKYKYVKLNVHPTEIVKMYSKPALTIGMRGHAQMIPFGCKTPILSIVSHEKMRYFLEDINHLEWGCEIDQPDFEQKLYDSAIGILSNKETIEAQITEAQQKLFDISTENMDYIQKAFKI